MILKLMQTNGVPLHLEDKIRNLESIFHEVDPACVKLTTFTGLVFFVNETIEEIIQQIKERGIYGTN